MTRTVLLVCGVLAALVYVGGDIIAASRYQDYSYRNQTVSELFAIDAPTRPFFVAMLFAHAALRVAFGVGVWIVAEGKRSLRIAGGLLIGMGLVDVAGSLAPMHQRTVLGSGGGSLTDTMHIVLASITVVMILLIIGFGAKAFGKRFRLYSIATIVMLVLFGAWSFADAPRISRNLPTPWVGVKERTNIYGYMLWTAVLAIGLLIRDKNTENTHADARVG